MTGVSNRTDQDSQAFRLKAKGKDRMTKCNQTRLTPYHFRLLPCVVKGQPTCGLGPYQKDSILIKGCQSFKTFRDSLDYLRWDLDLIEKEARSWFEKLQDSSLERWRVVSRGAISRLEGQ